MQAKFNGQKVRTLRKMKKLSQAMLAEQGDTSERYIRDLERGQKRNPSASVVCSLSRTLGLAAMDELMEITEEDRGE
ncbi:MAG: helix-turn-helix domain-containing protein [Ruthenibacterium sp.]